MFLSVAVFLSILPLTTGDQGGIAAYFFQSGVIAVYLLLLAVVLGMDFAARVKDKQSMKRNE
ncbi:MAG TPA: hypothetical protein DCF62_14915 [Porticoccaceae bacterium]|nr:hypothetical protein [Porticoccaceae bacterium]